MNLPITVNLSIETNETSFEITPQSIPTYDLSLDEPIIVQLQVDKSKRVYALALESNQHNLLLSNATAIVIQTGGDVPIYYGDYVVTPLAKSSVVLGTKNKKLLDDVTVLKIPTYQTHNDSGITFYIAEVS